MSKVYSQHVSQRLPCQCWIGIGELGNFSHMIHPIDVLGNSSRGDIPIVIFQRIEIDQGDGNVPIFAIQWIG